MSRHLVLIKNELVVESDKSQRERFQEELINQYRTVFPIHFEAKSLVNFNSALANYLPWLSDNGLLIWEVKPKDYDLFINHLKNNLENSTIVHYNCLISNFYDWATTRKREDVYEKFGIQMVNPVDRFNTPKRKKDDEELVEVPDNDVVNYYFQRAKQDFAEAKRIGKNRDQLILARQIAADSIMQHAGLRVDEVASLDIGDIDFEKMLILVREGKGRKDRIVDLSLTLAPILKWYCEQVYPELPKPRKRTCNPLFYSERRQRVSKKTIQWQMWVQMERYNIPIDQRFSPHGLRRLFATNLYLQLIQESHPDPIMYIKGQLGHVFVSTTLKYCRIPQAAIARMKEDAVAGVKSILSVKKNGGDIDDYKMESSPSNV